MDQTHGCFVQAQLFLQLSLNRGGVGFGIALLLLLRFGALLSPSLTIGGLLIDSNN
jgi:hypothetical protein